MLHDASMASRKSRARAPVWGWCPSRTRNPSISQPFDSAAGWSSYVVAGVMAPVLRAAIEVTILNADPGTYRPCVARGRSGARLSALSASKVAADVAGLAIAGAV